MEILILCLASFSVSLLTFFSGFGLGTLLMPVFALFFPIDAAIALTGVVHLLNNIFKFILLNRKVDVTTVLRFGVPAILGAYLGAKLLLNLSAWSPLFEYQLGGKLFYGTPIKLIIAALLVFFALMESLPSLKKIEFDKNKMVAGGLLSGFFGGLSGHQGALRSAFLIRSGLSKEAYIATGVLIACLVDVSRLFVYSEKYMHSELMENSILLVLASFSAFLGAVLGNLLLKKVTLGQVQVLVTVMLILLAAGLALGLV
ncbi:MAG TPA: sulfite exporter TauE/SafE family protein [Saprospiraceae bacterium]|nr:sulfite exporter TauE/SafE family protein [Saprospiraceae bacterium]